MPGTFEIKKAKDGHTFFHLRAANGQIILSSEMYKAKEGALNGIESVKKNAPHPERFEKHASKSGKFYFVLKAANTQVIANSEMYESEAARDNGIQAVMHDAPDAKVAELAAAI